MELLQAALIGYQAEYARITQAIAQIQAQLKRHRLPTVAAEGAQPTRKKHVISAAGRARIAAAQRKRWAAANKTTVSKPTAKRKLSAEAKAKLIENLKRAREAKAKKTKAA